MDCRKRAWMFWPQRALAALERSTVQRFGLVVPFHLTQNPCDDADGSQGVWVGPSQNLLGAFQCPLCHG